MIQNNPLCKCISDKAGPSCEAVREKHRRDYMKDMYKVKGMILRILVWFSNNKATLFFSSNSILLSPFQIFKSYMMPKKEYQHSKSKYYTYFNLHHQVQRSEKAMGSHYYKPSLLNNLSSTSSKEASQ